MYSLLTFNVLFYYLPVCNYFLATEVPIYLIYIARINESNDQFLTGNPTNIEIPKIHLEM